MCLKHFEELMLEHVAMLYAVALKLTRDPARAETLTKATLEEAFRLRKRVKQEVWPKAWLLTMLRSLFITNYYKTAQTRPDESLQGMFGEKCLGRRHSKAIQSEVLT
jgi:RNA polymerase sigma-70 factor (ECF subfamily)